MRSRLLKRRFGIRGKIQTRSDQLRPRFRLNLTNKKHTIVTIATTNRSAVIAAQPHRTLLLDTLLLRTHVVHWKKSDLKRTEDLRVVVLVTATVVLAFLVSPFVGAAIVWLMLWQRSGGSLTIDSVRRTAEFTRHISFPDCRDFRGRRSAMTSLAQSDTANNASRRGNVHRMAWSDFHRRPVGIQQTGAIDFPIRPLVGSHEHADSAVRKCQKSIPEPVDKTAASSAPLHEYWYAIQCVVSNLIHTNTIHQPCCGPLKKFNHIMPPVMLTP